MNNFKRGIKRTLAGAFAALMIVTALPETSIPAMANEPVDTIIDETDESVTYGSDNLLEDTSLSMADIVEEETDIEPFSSDDISDTISESEPDFIDPDLEGEGTDPTADPEDPVMHTITVEREYGKDIAGFIYSIQTVSPHTEKQYPTPFTSTSQSRISFQVEEGQLIRISKVMTSSTDNPDLSYYGYVNGVYVSDLDKNPYVTVDKDLNYTLSNRRMPVVSSTVSLPSPGRTNEAVVELTGASGSSMTETDGTTTTVYAVDKDTVVNISRLTTKTDQYNLIWNGEPTISYNVAGITTRITGCTVALTGGNYVITIPNDKVYTAIDAGASAITITPKVRALHDITISLAPDELSSAQKPTFTYTVYDENGLVYDAANNVSYDDSNNGANLTPAELTKLNQVRNKTASLNSATATVLVKDVPDGGYVVLNSMKSNNYNTYFSSATLTNIVEGSSADYLPETTDAGTCIINPVGGIAYHGNVTLNYAYYNYKVWQGAEDSIINGEKGLLHITNDPASSYVATFTGGITAQTFSGDVTGGYYTDVNNVDTDVTFSFVSQDIIKEVSWTYKNESGAVQTGKCEPDKPVSTYGNRVLLTAPSGGYGTYTCTIPAALIKSAKTALDKKIESGMTIEDAVSQGFVLSVTITKVPTYVVTMKIDGDDAKKSTHAKLLVYDSEETTRLNEKADSFVVTTGTTIKVKVTTNDENDYVKALKYGLSKVVITNKAGTKTETTPTDPTTYEFTYTLNDTDQDVVIDIKTELLNYLSYRDQKAAASTTKYISGDSSYDIQTGPSAVKKYIDVEYNTIMDVQYLIDGQAQILDRDYVLVIDGTELTDVRNETKNLPAAGEIISISGDGKKLSLKFVNVPGKQVLLKIGDVRKTTEGADDSDLEQRYIVFNVFAANFKVYVNENGVRHANGTSKTKVEMTGGSLAASGEYYIVEVPDTTQNPSFTLKAYVEEQNDLKYTVTGITIGSDNYTKAQGIAGITQTISSDTTINITTADTSYIAYKYPASSATETLIGGTIDTSSGSPLPYDEPVKNVSYKEKAIIEYRTGDNADIILSSGTVANGDFKVYLNETQLVGLSRTDPLVPALSEVATVTGNKTLYIDFEKCAATDNHTVNKVKVLIGNVSTGSGLAQKILLFEVAPVPYYTIDLQVNGTTPSASSFAQLTVKDITTSTAGTTLTPVDSSHPYTYIVKDQTKIKVTTEIPTQYTEQYELDHVKANGTKDDDLSDSLKTNSCFEFTAEASTTVAPASGSSSTTAGTATLDVITLPKTYLSYKLNSDNPVIIAKATDDHKYTAPGTTPYSDVAVIEYHTGNTLEDLTDDYSVMVGNATLGKTATATTPAIDSVATYNASTKALTIRFENVPDSKVIIKIGKVKTGSTVPVQKVLTYDTGSLPTRYISINVNDEDASTTSIATVTVKNKKTGQALTPLTDDPVASRIGKYAITAMTDIVITADINDDHKYKFNFSGATDKEDLAGSTAAATDPAPVISADKLNLTLDYKVTTNRIVNLTTDSLKSLEYTYPSGTGTPVSVVGDGTDPIYDVNYDQTATIRYMDGNTPKPLANKYKVYIGDKDTDPATLLTDSTTPKLAQVIPSTVSNSMIVDFTQCPNKTLKVVIGGGSTGLDELVISFNVTALRSHKIQVLVDGVAAPASTHAQVTITRVTAASAQTPVIPDASGYCTVSERDTLTITSSTKNAVKYQLYNVNVDGTTDPLINPASFTYTVGVQDAVINIITRGLPYISYTSSGTSGYLEGDTASPAGDVTADYAGATHIQYMMGDNPQAISLKDVVISMDNRVLTDVATDIYPAREDVMSLLDGARTLSLDFDSKKCRDHIFKIVIGDGTKLTKREISFKVPVIYTINYFDANGQAGVNNVIAVENYFYMNNIKLISGASTGAGTCTGTYDNDKKGNIVFALADSSNCSIDDIRKVEYQVEGSPAVELIPDDRGYYTLTRQLLEEFITHNKTIILILTTEPAVYETSLKLAKGNNYAPLYYNTDNSDYEIAYPVWSKKTTARKLQKIELYNESGDLIAAYDGITATGTYAGAIKYTTDKYSGISVRYNPGTNYTDGATTYHMPAGNYTIVAYAREPYSIQVSAKFAVKLGQGITRIEVDSNTQYLMKIPGKTATLKATALYYGGNRRINGIYSEDTTPSTRSVVWYPGDAEGNPLNVNDQFYGSITVRNGVFTLSKNANDTGVFYIWAKAADFSGNTVKAGRKVTVTRNKLTFNSVSMAYSGTEITSGSSFEAYQIFGSSTEVNGINRAYDRIVLKNGNEDVTGSFTIKISGASEAIYKSGILFNRPGTVTVKATANDGSKNSIKFSFTVLYGQGNLGYVLKNENFGLIEQSAIEQVTDYRRNVTVSNPYPASAGLHLSVFGLNKDDSHVLINHDMKIKGGKLLSRSQNIRSTEYVITPTKAITSITMTDTLGVDYTLTIQNKGLNLRKGMNVIAYSRNPVNNTDNKGKIYHYINYRQTETSIYYNKSIFTKYSEKRCNLVTYTFKKAQQSRNNVVLIETSSPYMGEIFLANGIKPVSTYEDGSGLYVTYLENGQFSIDYTMDDLGYLNIPKGKYQLYFTPGSASTDGGNINMSTFNASCQPVKYKLNAVSAPTGKVKVASTIKLDRSGSYGKLKFGGTKGAIKGSATFDMSSIKMAGQYPLKSVNKKGIINNFANDYEITKINHTDSLVFTGKGSTWLLDDTDHVSHKIAATNRMLAGYIPYAYQKADGTVAFDYALIEINDNLNGLTKY